MLEDQVKIGFVISILVFYCKCVRNGDSYCFIPQIPQGCLSIVINIVVIRTSHHTKIILLCQYHKYRYVITGHADQKWP